MPLANATRLGRRKELMNDAVLRHTNGARTADACIAAAFGRSCRHARSYPPRPLRSPLEPPVPPCLSNLLQLREQKASAQAASVETKEDSPALVARIENDETNLVPQTNTPSEPLPNSGKPSSTPKIPGKEARKLTGNEPRPPGKPSPDDIAA